MKISSRPRPRIDPLEEGQRFIAHTKGLLEDFYVDAIPETVAIRIECVGDQMITTISYTDTDGQPFVRTEVENTNDLLDV